MLRFGLIAIAILFGTVSVFAEEKLPHSLDDRLEIEIFAEAPQIVTPTGLDVDHRGRVWVIESNTHFRPDGYEGHPSDRVLVLKDRDSDHRADAIVPFLDGMTHTMSVAVALPYHRVKSLGEDDPESKETSEEILSVYIATRNEILLCQDTDGDLRCDHQQQLVHLETPGNYPHNGIAGFAFDALGWMYFGFGENLGAKYRIIGADGTQFSGGGEGGNLYRCRLDGTELQQMATGFWNPHASCFDAFGNLFTVDNDPDSRPPCRLLHVVPDGDYGYRFRNGRKGLHPFTAWNGEIPGTLPMVSGTGEAPSGIVAYESRGLPQEYVNNLLATSWGDHRIDRFELRSQGTSFTSKAEPIITGGKNFRPVGLALAPDGSLYCSDWVLKDYKLHGQGRVWRISAVEEPKTEPVDITIIKSDQPIQKLSRLLRSPRLEVRRSAAHALTRTPSGRAKISSILQVPNRSERARLEAAWALKKVKPQINLSKFLEKHGKSKPAGGSLQFQFALLSLLDPPWDSVTSWDGSLFSTETLDEPASSSNEGFGKEFQSRRDLYSDFYRLQAFEPGDNGTSSLATLADQALLRDDPFVFSAAVAALSRSDLEVDEFEEGILQSRKFSLPNKEAETKPAHNLAYLLAARKKFPQNERLARAGLKNIDVSVRRAAVQWVGEENLESLRPHIERLLTDGPMTQDLFMAILASLSILEGVKPAEFEKTPPAQYLLEIVQDKARSASLRAQALRMLPPAEPNLTPRLFRRLLKTDNEELKQEAVRTLQHVSIKQAPELLKPIAENRENPVHLRAEAIAGLARTGFKDKELSEEDQAARDFLLELIDSRQEPELIEIEAVRALRKVAARDQTVQKKLNSKLKNLLRVGMVTSRVRERADQLALALKSSTDEFPEWFQDYRWRRPKNLEGWLKLLEKEGDPRAGRRVFFHAHSAGCYQCHTVNGRGGKIGPDLSTIARTMDRKKLVESLLEPSREISPQFTSWTFVLKSGKVHNGLILEEDALGKITIGNADGGTVELPTEQITSRKPQKTSVMPDKLEEQMTVGELRDLLAFLETLR